mmetsp:Transcript_62300/g.94084  ORF Transcript_62300/g.94084 Transcript_62300/m.94084 type:complete len:106 (-) Transcript_62300:2265-2582(-)
MAPESSTSISRSNSSDAAPEGCCQAKRRTDDVVSSNPKQRGAESPLMVEAAVMLESFDPFINAGRTLRECKSIIVSAEQEESAPSMIPPASSIRAEGVSRAEPSD